MVDTERIVGATVAAKYRIRRIIGRGSMGVVCEAEHLEIGKRVAIKLIETTLTGMKDVAARFRREARATSLVESHHIVHVFDVGSDETLGLYLVMEYLTGEDLAQVLAREKRLAPARAVQIALQVARGLAKAHAAGVVHRDLKPANIFLCSREDDEPWVKILDFGISKVVDSSARIGLGSGLKLTRDGTVVGTPQYMSPEQAQGYAVDERTDLWALGLVLYEMLAGRPAYPELPTYEQFIIHLVSQPPEPLRGCAPWVSEELASVVHAAAEHDLGKRIQTCAELAKRLNELQAPNAPDGLEAADPPGQPAPPIPEDFEEDAPQFFDRKQLESLGPIGSNRSQDPDVMPPAASVPDVQRSAPVPRPPEKNARRAWVWPTLVVVGLALVAVAAFAFR
jgi:eukaryotic-like serine/threonine-protein kinase